MESRVSIQFTSLTSLWAFRMAISVNVFEMNLSQLMITCVCTPEHIQLAVEAYGGRVVEIIKEEANQ